MNRQWFLKGRLRIAMLGRGLFLFEFESLWEAERVHALGRKRVQENFLCLEKWTRRWGV